MYEELAKQLRERAAWINFPHHGEEYPTEDAKLMMDAADAIEKLQRHYCRHAIHNEHDRGDDSLCDKYKCEVNAFPKWIPVTERLPEDTYPVLVTYLGYFDKLPKSDMVAMWDDGDWYWYYDESKCKVAITHWMPLPQPPRV